MIKTENVTKVYKNGFKAVDQLSLNIEEGDIYGFLGPNGAGKTTTIRMLTGLIKPTSGKIIFGNKNTSVTEAELKKMIGVLPESHGYYNWMTAYEYLKYFYDLFEMDKNNAENHIVYLLKKVGLYERRHTPVGQFSRGMRQRLGLAKTLINSPKIIFLDEPTLGLDPTGQRDIHDLIKELNQSMNITVFITSHLLKDIEVLCNKVAIVKNGKLLVEESVSELNNRFNQDDIIKINTSNNPLAIQLLHEMKIKGSIYMKGDIILVDFDPSDRILELKKEILEKLISNGIDIYEISKQRQTVEDIFITLVTSDNKLEVR